MSEAPERIWAWPWNGEARRGQWNTSQINDGVEYIRADRIEALEARAEKAEKMSERFKDERDLLHDLYTHGRVTVKSPFERILEAEAERDELRDALKPFLKLAVSLDDINRARAALNREAGT